MRVESRVGVRQEQPLHLPLREAGRSEKPAGPEHLADLGLRGAGHVGQLRLDLVLERGPKGDEPAAGKLGAAGAEKGCVEESEPGG